VADKKDVCRDCGEPSTKSVHGFLQINKEIVAVDYELCDACYNPRRKNG
jgi:hypothetical protein